ncbi:MAG: hypothetical protein Q4F03_09405 [Eubacteriales bacterium]|nr:hypothetical protein [Eubacteriales bacterium]
MIEIGACIIGVIMMAELIAAIHLIKMSDKTNKVVRKERERLLTEIRIRMLAAHYSKKNQWNKAKEELDECLEELYGAGNPFGYEDIVYMTDNTWSEIADVIIMLAQLAMQHGKEDVVRQQMEYKLERQLKRIEEEESCKE